ncbi:hypothetical protein [Streptomyces meridianus]|uniref:Secreted protein n=1 Tax=Streptomyces meridianus TaxID=2938945 RepID=A0ABT0X5D3_9ACTN|nr:hypothetical protein [Streptomyces meridianus]MCM2577460.1 hypothetical protein [Streptomyces meridianus]
MPLHVPLAPSPALRSVLTALGSPTAVDERRTPALRRATGPLIPDVPLPVHVLERITPDGEGPRTALAGWRFLVRDGQEAGAPAVAAAQTALTADGWAFAHFVEGPYVRATERALAQAESIPDTAYQPRLLSVPELYMMTLWLHEDVTADAEAGRPASGDLLIPLAPAPPGIVPHVPRRVADLLPVMTLRVSTAALLGSSGGHRPFRPSVSPEVTSRCFRTRPQG